MADASSKQPMPGCKCKMGSKQLLRVVRRHFATSKQCEEGAIKRHYSTEGRPYSTAMELMPELFHEEEERVEDVTKPYSAIPGPKELPLVGNAWRFAPIIGQYKIHELDKVMWSLYKDYGRIVKVGGLIGHPDLLFVFNGEDIRRVFRQEEAMPHRPSMPSLHYYKQKLKKEFFEGNEGVIGVHGPKWEQFRKQVHQILLPPATARKYVEPLDTIASDFLTLMETSLDHNRELPDNFLSEIYKWALESVARVSLNTRLGCLDASQADDSESRRIIQSINTFFWNVAEVELKFPIWRLYHNKAFRDYIGALEDFRTVSLKYIEQTMQGMSNKDYVNVKEEDVSIVERILIKTGNPKLAAVLALDLMLVGVDTTSIALASTMYQLSRNPDKQQILYEELERALPQSNSKVTAEIQDSLPYLKACIKETLRMYPVIIGNGRSLQKDTILGGYHVPKGTHVIFPHLVVSNLTDYFTEPEKFIPERWLKKDLNTGEGTARCPAHHPFASLPFGYGRRSCLGRRFAETELNIMIAKIFRKYQVEYNYGELSYKITPTYVPEQPLKFKLTPRNC